MEQELVEFIANLQAPLSDDDKSDFTKALDMRDQIADEANEKVLHQVWDATLGIVDATHGLNHVFQNMSEDELRKYLGGDHSDFGVFQKMKLNGLISDAQNANRKALQSGVALSCPAN